MHGTRGVLYIKWGNAMDGLLERSMRSVEHFHPELKIQVHEEPPNSTMLCKVRMMEVSNFDTTLFLDLDTVLAARVDFALDRAEKHGLACCINECPWAKRFPAFTGDEIEYNTGVLAFTRAAKTVFDGWQQMAARINSDFPFHDGKTVKIVKFQDQAPFAGAVAETDFNPFILPLNYNFRPAWHKLFFGPIKIWHDPETPPPWLAAWNEEQSLPGAVIKFGER
jgi:hypothetical protein